MRMLQRFGVWLFLMTVFAPVGAAKVYLQWTQNTLPPPKVLGVDELVIPWNENAQTLAAVARKAGYRVYLEATLDKAAAVADAAANSDAAGIFLKSSSADQHQVEEAANQVRSKHRKLKVLVVSANGKQPEMRGWLVFEKNGILQVSSPTSQPWLDQNLAMVRYERAFETRQPPTYTFSWDDNDALMKANGPRPLDYALAVAEAGAFRADLILEVHEAQQKALARGDKEALADWEKVKRTISFYEHEKTTREAANVLVLTNDYDNSYEALNLMARHNIPFRVLHADSAKAADLLDVDVLVTFATPNKELIDAIGSFAERGGVAVLVDAPGKYPWDSAAPGKKDGPSVTHTVGKGRVIELEEPVSDPETFAQDVRRLMTKGNIPVGLWNSLTTLVVEYPSSNGEWVVELVNYDEEPTAVQVQVKGNFREGRYESPEKGCCQKLQIEKVGGFTDIVIPDLVVGGRILLADEEKK